ncbi:hypothetical protein L1987_80558 [Smallanthus sonchifolius]|uniref:Uncharacterized protein n=1 Tax=Smallanthus sonchifolius TaxID=185202 RepID=A0ACB8YNG5_9ASTR|nr:hypothetical protein L1987_80558 [Smallanthus sonchifolius]
MAKSNLRDPSVIISGATLIQKQTPGTKVANSQFAIPVTFPIVRRSETFSGDTSTGLFPAPGQLQKASLASSLPREQKAPTNWSPQHTDRLILLVAENPRPNSSPTVNLHACLIAC